MTSLRHCHIVVLPLTNISIKLIEYRSKWTRNAKIEQKILNMTGQHTLHVRLFNLLFVCCLPLYLCYYKYPVVDNWLYTYATMKPAMVPVEIRNFKSWYF